MGKLESRSIAARVAAALSTWDSLVGALPSMSEKELSAALKQEAGRPRDERRLDIIKRLHRRYTRVRKERELQEYLS